MTVAVFLTFLILTLWKECWFLFLFLSLAVFGLHPIAALGIAFVGYLIAFIWEKFHGSERSGIKAKSRRETEVS